MRSLNKIYILEILQTFDINNKNQKWLSESRNLVKEHDPIARIFLAQREILVL
jgi:hypothetical protein